MEDLVRWLGEQLDVDVREIADAYPATAWHSRNCESVPDVLYPDRETGACDCGVPDRLLREIDAKRRLLAAYAQVAANDVNELEYAHGWANALGEAVRLLAPPYADRPGYREEWKP